MTRKGWLGLALAAGGACALFFCSSSAKPPKRGPAATPAAGPEATASTARRHRAVRPRLAPPRRRSEDATPPMAPTTEPPPAPERAAPTPAPRATQLATTVLQAAVQGQWMTTDDEGHPCPPQDVRIVYAAPDDLKSYTKGAFFEPLGPSPGEATTEVNGMLLCRGSTYLYRGFEAYYRDERGQWDVYPFPVIE